MICGQWREQKDVCVHIQSQLSSIPYPLSPNLIPLLHPKAIEGIDIKERADKSADQPDR